MRHEVSAKVYYTCDGCGREQNRAYSCKVHLPSSVIYRNDYEYCQGCEINVREIVDSLSENRKLND